MENRIWMVKFYATVFGNGVGDFTCYFDSEAEARKVFDRYEALIGRKVGDPTDALRFYSMAGEHRMRVDNFPSVMIAEMEHVAHANKITEDYWKEAQRKAGGLPASAGFKGDSQ